MLIGVGLGCLVQMVKTSNVVQVIFSHKHTHTDTDTILEDVNVTRLPLSSVWAGGFADVGSSRISGSVSGPVLHHCSTVPVPPGSDLRDLPPRLLRHLPPHCAAHRVWNNPRSMIWLRPGYNKGRPHIRGTHWSRGQGPLTTTSSWSIDALFIPQSTLAALSLPEAWVLKHSSHFNDILITTLLRESWHQSSSLCLYSTSCLCWFELRWHFVDPEGKHSLLKFVHSVGIKALTTQSLVLVRASGSQRLHFYNTFNVFFKFFKNCRVFKTLLLWSVIWDKWWLLLL